MPLIIIIIIILVENQHVLDFENTQKLLLLFFKIFIEINFGQKTKIVI